ncbi:hypothetical protein CCH79_00015784, partial [Gambusia affinis]
MLRVELSCVSLTLILTMPGNPWSCDCELHRVFSKILHVRYLHIDDYRNVTCKDPPQLVGASLAWVDSQLCVAETATVLVITITVLVTVVAAVVMAERNRKKSRGKNWDADSQISSDSHSGVIQQLDLSWNQITTLPVDFSSSLSALKELRMEHNNLNYISGFSLEHLDNMEKLDLSYNQLVSVGPGVFRGLSRLRQLFLHNNRLTAVEQGSLDMLPGLE